MKNKNGEICQAILDGKNSGVSDKTHSEILKQVPKDKNKDVVVLLAEYDSEATDVDLPAIDDKVFEPKLSGFSDDNHKK